MKNAIVCSHERSGTHFLMNSLALNFGYIARPWVDFDCPWNPYGPDNIIYTFNQLGNHEFREIIKCHYPAQFLMPVLKQKVFFEDYNVFYIFRDGDKVMDSFAKHLNDIKWFEGPKAANGETLATMEPGGGMLRYQWIQHLTVWHRWEFHVNSWRDLPSDIAKDIIYVKFEDLDGSYDDVIRDISARTGLNCGEHPKRPAPTKDVIMNGSLSLVEL